MISASDINGLRQSFTTFDGLGLPMSLATDCARILGVSDINLSLVGAFDQVLLCSSSDDSSSLDAWEFTLLEGPCLDAAATGVATTAETAPSHTNPWPRLSAKADAMGYRSIAGIPWQLEGTTFATFNLQDRDHVITAETLADAGQIAAELTSLLVRCLAQRPPSLHQLADHDMFHQATGMVMTQMGIDAVSAIDVLRAHAWTHDLLLMDVASEVVTHTLTFPPARPQQ